MEPSPFGPTLRRWRERVAPESVGVHVGGTRRRTAGLRREELAGLAGISADYLTRLEQGRSRTPSAQVVEALARALRLSDAERDVLHQQAGHAAPGHDVVPTRITPSVQRLLDRLTHTPVAVFDATWNLLVANAPYEAVMGATSTWSGVERNAVWRHLAGPGSRVVMAPEQRAELESGLVGDLRLTASRYPADRTLARLLGELRRIPRFVALWESADPAPAEQPAKNKTIAHPAVGPITLACDTLVVATDDLRIMVYTAEPATEDAERLELAVVLGTQVLVD